MREVLQYLFSGISKMGLLKASMDLVLLVAVDLLGSVNEGKLIINSQKLSLLSAVAFLSIIRGSTC